MKKLILLFSIYCISINCFAQQQFPKKFKLTDTVFDVGSVYFLKTGFSCSGGFKILPNSQILIDSIAVFLNKNRNIKVIIEAHTDLRGDEIYNDTISLKHAQSICKYLIEKGIDSERLEPVGYGEQKPFVVDLETSKKFPYLPYGQVLDMDFINTLESLEQKEQAFKLNRRCIVKIVEIE